MNFAVNGSITMVNHKEQTIVAMTGTTTEALIFPPWRTTSDQNKTSINPTIKIPAIIPAKNECIGYFPARFPLAADSSAVSKAFDLLTLS